MPADHIRYDLLTQDALRGVIRTVLADVAVKGLPGEHHFFITFDTRADGVRMSARLRASYPGEMTIVLQHQFWDLTVGEDDFEVGLAFNGIPERLHVPLKAVRAFMDPAVQFGLQFTVDVESTGEAKADVPAEPSATAAKPAPAEKPAPTKRVPAAKSPKPQPKKESGAQTAATGAGKPAPPSAPSKEAPSKEAASGEVVRLDRFRKK
jgi:hypothetical protein